MSTIVGIIEGGKALLGADSASTSDSGDHQVSIALPKLVRFSIGKSRAEGLIVGFSGDHAIQEEALALRDTFAEKSAPESDPESLTRFLAEDFVKPIRERLKEREKIDSGVMNGRLLVGYRDALAEVQWGTHVRLWTLPFCAVGSGARYALGALSVLYGTKNERLALRGALQAADLFDAKTRGPFVSLGVDSVDGPIPL